MVYNGFQVICKINLFITSLYGVGICSGKIHGIVV